MKREQLYSEITTKIVTLLEQGIRPWTASRWASGAISRPLRSNGVAYQGINALILWLYAADRGYGSPYYLTYRTAQELGGQVRKGEKSIPVLYYNVVERKNEQGEEVEIPFARVYAVFNAQQIDGLPKRYYPEAGDPLPEDARIARAEEFVRNTGIAVREEGITAYYSRRDDAVTVPPFARFKNADGFYATVCHELAHATGYESRLDRQFGKKFGDHHYAAEELVAEISSAFVTADLGLNGVPIQDNAAYIASWITVLKSNDQAIFTAAAMASKAAAWLWAQQPQPIAAE
jgi:antirestriction protein ArdC